MMSNPLAMCFSQDFIAHVGTDARKWAEEFSKTARDLGMPVHEDMLICWFNNAIQTAILAGRHSALNE